MNTTTTLTLRPEPEIGDRDAQDHDTIAETRKRRLDQMEATASLTRQQIFGDYATLKRLTPCQHLLDLNLGVGKCSRAAKCSYAHAGTPEDWKKIPRGLGPRSAGAIYCKAGQECIYRHGPL